MSGPKRLLQHVLPLTFVGLLLPGCGPPDLVAESPAATRPAEAGPTATEVRKPERTASSEDFMVTEPSSSSHAVDVKFARDVDPEAVLDLLPEDLRAYVTQAQPLFQIRDPSILTARPDLSRWFRLSLQGSADPVRFVEQVTELQVVETAEVVPPPAPPPGGSGAPGEAAGDD